MPEQIKSKQSNLNKERNSTGKLLPLYFQNHRRNIGELAISEPMKCDKHAKFSTTASVKDAHAARNSGISFVSEDSETMK